VGEEGRSKWCPFEYEFLPEFCYNCGIIGHDDKCCPVQIKKGEEKQFGSWLRAFIPKKQNSSERQRWSGGGGSGSGGRSYELGDRRGTAGSNSFSWRKEESNKMASENSNREDREQEVTSPLKRTTKKTVEGNPDGPRRTLDWDASSERKEQEETQGDKRTIEFTRRPSPCRKEHGFGRQGDDSYVGETRGSGKPSGSYREEQGV
jgi:hypothetical protein